MTQRIARLALAGAAAAAAFAATPASAEHCINMGTTPVECTLEQIAINAVCIPFGTYEICPAVAG